MKEHEYNPIHIHRGSLFTGLSSVMILDLPDTYGVEYSAKEQPIVDQVMAVETWEDVIEACKALYAFMKENQKVEEDTQDLFSTSKQRISNLTNNYKNMRKVISSHDIFQSHILLYLSLVCLALILYKAPCV